MARKRKPAPKVEEPSSSSSSEEEEEEEEEEEDQQQEEEVEEESSESEEEEDEDEDEDEEEEFADENSKREAIRKLLQPFGRDQLIDLLKSAALQNRSIVSRLRRAADSDPAHRKIFVHGLAWDATSDTLMSIFKPFGPIQECNVVTDKLTGKSKGYGFVLFETRSGARKSLKEPQKKIGSRLASCQLASTGPASFHPAPEPTGRKLYVSGVGPGIDPGRLRVFFESFGEIEAAPPGCDRGFAIFTYKTAEGCKKALEEPIKVFEGCQLNCQRAFEGPRPNQMQMGSGHGILQPGNVGLHYASASLMGLNPGLMAHQNLNSMGSAFGGQNLPLGAGLSASVGSGLSPTVNRSAMTQMTPSPYGTGLGSLGLSGQSGINSISPSVIGSYGSQAALQGLGAYQSVQSGQSPASAARSQSGIGSIGGYPSSYFGR